MSLFLDRHKFDDLIEVVEEQIPLILSFLTFFIFVIACYRAFGKSRSLYWFMLFSLFAFDVTTLGLTADYLKALNHAFICCDEDL